MTSIHRQQWRMRDVTACRSASPIGWPHASLTFLKWSRFGNTPHAAGPEPQAQPLFRGGLENSVRLSKQSSHRVEPCGRSGPRRGRRSVMSATVNQPSSSGMRSRVTSSEPPILDVPCCRQRLGQVVRALEGILELTDIRDRDQAAHDRTPDEKGKG